MEQTSRQRNQCNPDRSHRKPLLRGLVNGKSHLRRNRRYRPPRQGTEKERREGHPIPTAPLTPTDPPRSHCIPSSPHPVSTSLPHIVPNLSDPCPRKSGHRFGNIGNSWNLRVAGRNWNGYATANHPLNPFAFGEPFGNPATFSKPMGFF